MFNTYRENLVSLLKKVNSIAIVGASSNPGKDSHKVMKFLIENGYTVFPVNPNESNNLILNQKCYSNLNEIKDKIDMVEIFRAKEFIFEITREAIAIKADILWMQEGIRDEKSAILANNAGLKVIMDACPKKILDEKE